MKAGFDQSSTMKWFLHRVATSDKAVDKFNQLIEAEGWDCDNVDLKIVLNGIEFADVEDVFLRLHQTIEEQDNEISDLHCKLKRYNEMKELMREEIEKEIEQEKG